MNQRHISVAWSEGGFVEHPHMRPCVLMFIPIKVIRVRLRGDHVTSSTFLLALTLSTPHSLLFLFVPDFRSLTNSWRAGLVSLSCSLFTDRV